MSLDAINAIILACSVHGASGGTTPFGGPGTVAQEVQKEQRRCQAKLFSCARTRAEAADKAAAAERAKADAERMKDCTKSGDTTICSSPVTITAPMFYPVEPEYKMPLWLCLEQAP